MEISQQVQQKLVNSFILLDDDEVVHFINRKLISSLVSNSKINSFTSGFEVLKHLENHPDEARMLIIDLDMPVMNGWVFLDALASRKYNQSVYILSSSAHSMDRGRIGEYGFVRGYFIKPLNLNDIFTMLENSRNGLI